MGESVNHEDIISLLISPIPFPVLWIDAKTHQHEVHSHCNINPEDLHGSVACLTKGPGLVKSTTDIMKLHGGAPVKFLNVGGGTIAEQVQDH
ncbi:hypothetical protein BX616_004842 [Lobosporangium transversale]|nr:hypothetical protein BX616_004842 [Lobosporangium transversale]